MNLRTTWIPAIRRVIFCPLAVVTAHLAVEAMPTVLSRSGFDVGSISTIMRDHATPHVHVIRQSGEARIGLLPVMIFGIHGFTRSESAKAKQLVQEEKEFLLRKWMELHGPTIVSN
jgi:hypothetical protein